MTETAEEYQPSPSDLCEFIPQKDITAYEVALLLTRLQVTALYSALLKMPKEIRRHFVPHRRSAPDTGTPTRARRRR